MNRYTPACNCCSHTVNVTLTGCGGVGLDGETVTVSQSGTTVATAVTDGSGIATFSLASGSYTVSASPARFSTATGSFTVASITVNYTLAATASSSYVCLTGCARPVNKTLFWTCADTGAATVTFVGVTAGVGQWIIYNRTNPVTGLPQGLFFDGGHACEPGSWTNWSVVKFFSTQQLVVTMSTGAPNFTNIDVSYSPTSSTCPPAFTWTLAGGQPTPSTSPQVHANQLFCADATLSE